MKPYSLQQINKVMAKHKLTLEQAIEYVMETYYHGATHEEALQAIKAKTWLWEGTE